jgi:phage terminase small subunit
MGSHNKITGLTDKQLRVFTKYIETGSITKAMEGECKKGNEHNVFDNMKKSDAAKKFLDKHCMKKAKKSLVTINRILEEEEKLAFFDIKEIFDDKGCPIPPNKLPSVVTRAISQFDVEVCKDGTMIYRYKMNDKGRSLERLSKFLGMYIERKITADTTVDALKEELSKHFKVTTI